MNKQHPIPFDKVNITGGFWKDRIALNESVTLDSVRRTPNSGRPAPRKIFRT